MGAGFQFYSVRKVIKGSFFILQYCSYTFEHTLTISFFTIRTSLNSGRWSRFILFKRSKRDFIDTLNKGWWFINFIIFINFINAWNTSNTIFTKIVELMQAWGQNLSPLLIRILAPKSFVYIKNYHHHLRVRYWKISKFSWKWQKKSNKN